MYKKNNQLYWNDWNSWETYKNPRNAHKLKDKKKKLFFIKIKLLKKKKNIYLKSNWGITRLQLSIKRKIYSNKNKYITYKKLNYDIIIV